MKKTTNNESKAGTTKKRKNRDATSFGIYSPDVRLRTLLLNASLLAEQIGLTAQRVAEVSPEIAEELQSLVGGIHDVVSLRLPAEQRSEASSAGAVKGTASVLAPLPTHPECDAVIAALEAELQEAETERKAAAVRAEEAERREGNTNRRALAYSKQLDSLTVAQNTIERELREARETIANLERAVRAGKAVAA